jgi:hypothetical protein
MSAVSARYSPAASAPRFPPWIDAVDASQLARPHQLRTPPAERCWSPGSARRGSPTPSRAGTSSSWPSPSGWRARWPACSPRSPPRRWSSTPRTTIRTSTGRSKLWTTARSRACGTPEQLGRPAVKAWNAALAEAQRTTPQLLHFAPAVLRLHGHSVLWDQARVCDYAPSVGLTSVRPDDVVGETRLSAGRAGGRFRVCRRRPRRGRRPCPSPTPRAGRVRVASTTRCPGWRVRLR